MHISEGILSGPVLISGGVLAAAGTAVGLKRLDYDRIAQAGILAAAFFVAALIHVPIGPASVHLILNGIIGLMLGWGAFPVIVAALLLQAVFFQFGGITTLGVNTLIMAAPAVAVHYLLGGAVRRTGPTATAAAFTAGAGSILVGAVLAGASLVFTDEGFWHVTVVLVVSHLPVMVIEGLITAFCVAFLKKVQPELLDLTPSESGHPDACRPNPNV